jgi:hypothetical protein
MIRVLNIKQILEIEGLLDCVKRFKQSRNITMSHVGKDVLDKLFIKNTRKHQDKTDSPKQESVTDGALNKWTACLLIRSSNQSKSVVL